MWNRISNGTIVECKYYLTCVQKFGEINNVQKMCFKRGLWWTEDGMYTYFTPSHYKEIV